MPPMQPFRTHVRDIRLARGLTQLQLARLADLPTLTIWRIETGRNVPTLATAFALARALAVPIEELVEEDTERAA